MRGTNLRTTVSHIELNREKGYLYFVDGDGDISRTKRSTGHYRERHPHEKVMSLGLKKKPGMWYFISSNGDIIQQNPNKGKTH